MESHAAHCILPTNTQHLMKLHCTEKKPWHYFVTKLKWAKSLSLVTKLKICNWHDTSYLLPIYIKQRVVSSIFKCSSTGEQQKHFQTSAALQENNKTIFRQFKQQSALCKKLISTICTNISWFMITSFVNSIFSQPHSQRTFNSILHCGVSFEVMVTTQPQIHHRSSPLSSFDPEKE